MNLTLDKVPRLLRGFPHWVVWRMEGGDANRKMPFSCTGAPAKANDSATWGTFADCLKCFQRGGYSGPGFEFAEGDPFCGVDLDGCRDPATGKVADWAREIIKAFATYAEVSPSQTGVKLFGVGSWRGAGNKTAVDAPMIGAKHPAIEVYDHGRYFAVTGWRLEGESEPQPCQPQLDALAAQYFQQRAAAPAASSNPAEDERAIIDRARKYLAKVPPAVSGSGGHNATFTAACTLVIGFALSQDDAYQLLAEWNMLCQPPWSERDLRHKLEDAAKQPEERGYLRRLPPARLMSCALQHYTAPSPQHEPNVLTLSEATRNYFQARRAGQALLVETGIGDLDYALGGGVGTTEMVIIAARPSHGKSACGLQLAHHWTAQGMPVLFASEEMSPIALGKRTVQFASAVPEEHWDGTRAAEVEADVDGHFAIRAPCYIAEACRSAKTIDRVIRRHRADHDVQAVIVDYAQLLAGAGKSRYEQVADVSVTLRGLTNELGIIIVALCQLNREIEKREKFVPKASDLRDAGQLEQDADVIVFGVWPHRIEEKQPPNKYWFYISKNRNRAIMQAVVEARFDPARQAMLLPRVIDTRDHVDQQERLQF
jgi:archaellum biogenesis ATPase FlaH